MHASTASKMLPIFCDSIADADHASSSRRCVEQLRQTSEVAVDLVLEVLRATVIEFNGLEVEVLQVFFANRSEADARFHLSWTMLLLN